MASRRSAAELSTELLGRIDELLTEIGQLDVRQCAVHGPEADAQGQAAPPLPRRRTAVDVEEGHLLDQPAARRAESAYECRGREVVGGYERQIDIRRRKAADLRRQLGPSWYERELIEGDAEPAHPAGQAVRRDHIRIDLADLSQIDAPGA